MSVAEAIASAGMQIEANNYYFYEDGTLAAVTEYIRENHVYKVELKHNGVIYDITDICNKN